MPWLTITALPDSERAALFREASERKDPRAGHVIDEPAGEHTVVYCYAGTIRWDDPYYHVRVAGRVGAGITSYLEGRVFFYRSRAYNASLNWYLFEETDPRSAGCTFHVIDLSSGQPLSTYTDGGWPTFACWRPNSTELLFARRSDRKDGFLLDAVSGHVRRLAGGAGYPGYNSTNGRWAIFVNARPSAPDVTLFDLATGQTVDRATLADVAPLPEQPFAFTPVRFDADTPRLIALLSCSRFVVGDRNMNLDTEEQRRNTAEIARRGRSVGFQRAIAIEVVDGVGY